MFAIYTLLTARRCGLTYFVHPLARQPGPSRVACLPVLACQTTQRSYLVARVNHRVETQGMHWQGGGRHKQPKRVCNSWYHVKSTEYLAISIGWDRNDIQEHSAHATREEAVAAARALHASAGR